MKIWKVNAVNEDKKKNVAAYARVSTLSEEQEESFDTQVQYYTALISNTEEWNFVGVYADHGKSGLSVEHRPEFQRMIKDAEAGKIDLILVKSISRFGRNSLEAQTYVHKLKELRVEVRFEREGISSFNPQADMVFSFLAAVAQEESRSTSENLKWAFAKKAEQGIRHVGNRILGYKEVDGVLTPDENAWAVRFMFESYADGMTFDEIATKLEERGFTTKMGKKKLGLSAISVILRNEVYKGDRQIQKAPHTNVFTHRPEKDSEYTTYYIENDHEAIVSKELWEKVQKVLAEPKSGYKTKASHYLRAKVVCGNCGELYMRTTRQNKKGKYKKWICKGQLASSGCKNVAVKEDDLLRFIEEKIGASDEEACKLIEEVLVFPDGRIEIHTVEG